MSKLHIAVSPHFHAPVTTQKIMLDVIIALLPTTVCGTLIFGIRALAVIATAVGFAVLSELIFNICAKKPATVQDLSAVVTGLLLALTVPASIPLWQVALGSIFAIVFVKGVFGGIGQNFANPAITARIFMLLAFGEMTEAPKPTAFALKLIGVSNVDAVTSATPLAEKMSGFNLMEMLFGVHAGAIGEVCTVALLIGFIYLLVKKVITWHTPVFFICTVFLFTLLLTKDANLSMLYTCAGGVFIGAIFMATDYATTPTRPAGKAIFGILAAVITVMIRQYGSLPEGVSYAILFMNILTPYIDKWTLKKPFGVTVNNGKEDK